MSQPPEGDTSLGMILVSMGICTSGQVTGAAEEQKRSAEDKQIGMFLVAGGSISKEQLEMALETQEGLRSKSVSKRAMAQAAIAQKSGETVADLASYVRGKSDDLKRHSSAVHKRITTGIGHPAVTDEMLAKGKP